MVRDILKNKEYFKEYIAEEQSRINKFENKLRNNEVREDRVFSVKRKIYDLKFQIFVAKYSMGEPVKSLIEDYKFIVEEMKEFWDENLYEDMLWILSIGIMLEIDEDTFNILVKLIENSEMNDFLYNFIIHSRKENVEYQNSPLLFEEPFKSLMNVIMYDDNLKASISMKEYLLEKWYIGHKDMGWYESHRHQEKLYFGYWSFESGAIVKILGLDDIILKNIPYYPYELAHYKNSMKFNPISISNNEHEIEEIDEIIEGIENNPSLKKIIPIRWHSFVNELIHDYDVLDDSSFYEKYKKLIGLDQIWFLLQEYEKENKQKNLLGSLIVFAMTEKGYILQLDYKEDVEEYYSGIKNYWNDTKTKLVQFILNNDQNYYALVPIDENIGEMYEVIVKDVK